MSQQVNESAGSSNRSRSSFHEDLKLRHPELFLVSPRPGGFVDRQNRILKEGTSSRIQEIKDRSRGNIRCPDYEKVGSKKEEKDYLVKVSSIAVSTVMKLAQDSHADITSSQAKTTEEYFKCLKEENPQLKNIDQILRVLQSVKKIEDEEEKSPEDSDNEDLLRSENPDDDLKITDLIT